MVKSLQAEIDAAKTDAQKARAEAARARATADAQAESIVEAVGSPVNGASIAAAAKDVYEQINDILSEMRNNMRLVKDELPNMTGQADTMQAVSAAVEALVDNAETAKGALRGLKELAEAK